MPPEPPDDTEHRPEPAMRRALAAWRERLESRLPAPTEPEAADDALADRDDPAPGAG